jgi:hypothetical protein
MIYQKSFQLHCMLTGEIFQKKKKKGKEKKKGKMLWEYFGEFLVSLTYSWNT